jgi:hypothetical protein
VDDAADLRATEAAVAVRAILKAHKVGEPFTPVSCRSMASDVDLLERRDEVNAGRREDAECAPTAASAGTAGRTSSEPQMAGTSGGCGSLL